MDNKYLTRKSYFDVTENRSNKDLQLGYDYSKTLLKNSLSKLIFGNDKRDAIIADLNKLYVYLVNSTKRIKKTFAYATKRNSNNIN